MISLCFKTISQKIDSNPVFKDFILKLRAGEFPLALRGPQGSFQSILIRKILQETNEPILLVPPTEAEADLMQRDLEVLETPVFRFPWRGLPYSDAMVKSRVHGDRVRFLQDIQKGEKGVYIASLRSALDFLPSPHEITCANISFKIGQSIDPQKIAVQLVELGYMRVPRVSVAGEFALRGEVLDVYMPGHDNAFRIVFEWDEIEDIKYFDPSDQSSTGKVKEITIHQTREVIWTADAITQLMSNLEGRSEINDEARAEIEETLLNGAHLHGEDNYYALSYKKPSTILDYLSPNTVVLLPEYERLFTAAEALEKEYTALFRKKILEKRYPRPQAMYANFEELEAGIKRKISIPLFKDKYGSKGMRIICEPPRSFFGNFNFMKEELQVLLDAGYKVFVFAEGDVQAKRIAHLLQDFNVSVVDTPLSGGFTLTDEKIITIHENEIFGRRKRVAKASFKKVESKAIESFVELNPGDYVVHINHGIGRFEGIARIKAAGNERDYIHLQFAKEEYIYVPIEQVNMVQRYIGSQGNAPKLDIIGGKSWETRTSRARKSVEDLADHLIDVYSRRMAAKGYGFPKDTEWQIEFEASFPYEETEDQLRCIDEVKVDMEEPKPMDRLICGDVGYGKTEIAMRAAFKAAASGKQVAILAPTTILAEQHYENFEERLKNFPLKIGHLSRFVTKKDQKTVLEKVEAGQVDILVGTHRIIQKDVKYKDLGLIIIDEEQRFGVKDKEKLKDFKASIDALTLTATPIPRTLHMSMLKIRDMSVLKTPPYNRLPIETTIREFNEDMIADAIRREIARGGQVYYLHNRVETLDSVRIFLEKIVPELLIETAHGKMTGSQLEEKMHRFINGGFHVLVSTTIIESGIDIPNVNTIIIDRADMYGISQLYQLRGRVGRSGKLAYAFLFYPEGKALSELAMKRLQIISDNTELGAGFKIAMKDLEVRGAGNLLGRQQSGEIVSVGFEMYLSLLEQAVKARQGDEVDEAPEVYMELDYTGFIPETYISDGTEKMDIYKKIAAVKEQGELDGLAADLEDRYGPMPDEVQSLLSLAEIRVICNQLYISAVRERKGSIEVEFSKFNKISIDRLMELMQMSAGAVRLRPDKPNSLIIQTGSIGLKEKSEFLRSRLSSLI